MFEYLVGLNVTNDEVYQQYREAMIPILKTFDGGFNYDFKIAEVLKKQTEDDINRVFTIYFPSKQDADDFFSDKEYLKVKENYFEKSVKSITIIAGYTT